MLAKVLQRVVTFREFGTILLLLLVTIFACVKEPRFLEASNFNAIMLSASLLIAVGVGQMLVIVTRGIDVSIGSQIGLCAMVVGLLFKAHPTMNVFVGTSIGLLAGLVLGSINGGLISFARVPPIITTLGTLSAYRGICFILSKGDQVNANDLPDSLTKWSIDGPLQIRDISVPWIVAASLAIAIIAACFVAKTRAGRDVFALGSNPEAARLRGLPVQRTTFLVYAITGALAGLTGVFVTSRFGFVNASLTGQGMELQVIAAVVIGGTNVAGGSGTVMGVVLGAVLLGTINQAISVLGVDPAWQPLVYGLVILIAVIFDTLLKKTLAKVGAQA